MEKKVKEIIDRARLESTTKSDVFVKELLDLFDVIGSTDIPKPYEWLKVEKFNITHGATYNEPKFSMRQCASWISEYAKKYYR